jgi:phosphoglycerol transferase MdoB-like AlkP superfamily enzyme
MFQRVKDFFIKPFIYWLIVFALFKLLFLLVHYNAFEHLPAKQVLKVFTEPIRLDLAAVSYIMFIPVMALLIQFLIKTKFIHHFSKWYFLSVLLLVSIICVVDIELYKHWQTKMNFKAFLFLNEPAMIAGSAGFEAIFQFFVIIIISLLILALFYLKKIYKTYSHPHFTWQMYFLLLIFLPAILVVGIRGGLQQIPVNQSDAYYSSNPTLNYAGVNSLWNFGNIIFQNKKYRTINPYKKMNAESAKDIVHQLFEVSTDSIEFFIEPYTKPNIILIALEGINPHVIKGYNTSMNHAPVLNSIMQTGYSFTQMYGSGLRTDQGLVSIISGFPALPLNTIGAQPEKFQQLPSLSKTLNEAGYQSHFHFGGEPEFGSFKSFLVHNEFSPIVDFRDFPKSQLTQKLGAPDEFLFQKHLKDSDAFKEPFFSLILTQTTHEPFDMPFNKNIANSKEKYLNTVAYTDSVLGWWLKEIEQKDYYNNSLIIFTSDHGHRFPGEYWYSDPMRFQIPFIIWGPKLKAEYQGQQNNKPASQTDIPKTLLAQLQLPHSDFAWSKNLMNPYSPEFAFFIYINGFMWLKPTYTCGYEYNYDKVEFMSEDADAVTCLKEGQAYLQHIFQTYLEY